MSKKSILDTGVRKVKNVGGFHFGSGSLEELPTYVETRRAKLGNITGGLSGPAIHPIAVKMVWEVAKAVKIPLVAMGGITRAEDAIEFLLAGATAVAVGTANFTDPSTALAVVSGIESYLERHGVASVRVRF